MPNRRRVRRGRRRGGRGWGGHVRVLEIFLAGTRRRRRAPGTVSLPLHAPPPGVVGALRARHSQERGSRNGGRDGQRGLKTPCGWEMEADAAAVAVVCAYTHGTRRTRARETPQGPQRARLRWGADRWLPACVRLRRAKASRVWAARGIPPNAPSACLGGKATACAAPVLSGTRPKNVERARGQRDRSPHTLPHVAGDRLSAPSDCSRREAPLSGLTCASRARLTNGCVAHARDEGRPGPPSPQKKAAPAGHV